MNISKNLPEIIKSIKKMENNHKNSYFDLGRNPMEIVHGPLKLLFKESKTIKLSRHLGIRKERNKKKK